MMLWGSKLKARLAALEAKAENLSAALSEALGRVAELERTAAQKPVLHCSFCGKSQHEVRKLIAAPKVFICDECVDLCTEICTPPEAKP